MTDVDTVTSEMEKWGKTNPVFGLRLKGDPKGYLLILKDEFCSKDPLGSLDVTVLHSFILENILGVNKEAQEKQANLKYIKDANEAWKKVSDPDSNILFLMNSTKLDQIRIVAKDHLLMPQKSTFFYPKVVSGLAFHAVGPEDKL